MSVHQEVEQFVICYLKIAFIFYYNDPIEVRLILEKFFFWQNQIPVALNEQ